MKGILFWFVFLIVQCGYRAQEVIVKGFEKNEETLLHKIRQKKTEYHAFNNGKIPGYRIKIFFGKSKEDARLVKSKFTAKFPDIPAYEDYDLPNFIVVAGNYRFKAEAMKMLKKIKPEFPFSFIVKDYIEIN